MLIANHYVRINGQMYMKGEVIPEISVEKAEWLLSVGAVQLSDNKGKIITESAEEMPEINVMEGIVKGETEPKPKPKKTTGGKKK